MQAEGVKSLFNISDLAVMGLAEVIPSIPRVLRRINETVADIQRVQPDVVVTIDSWSFSARVHKKLRRLKLNIPQVHYVAPQVWAWKKKRARTMHKYIDLLLTLFPQEPRYFTPYNRLLLVLPGSRHNEVERLLPTFLEVVKQLHERYNDFSFVIPTVGTVAAQVKDMVKQSGLPIEIVEGTKERHDAFKSGDVAIAASGTVALELAIVDVPHIIAYKVPKLTEWLARHFIHIQFVNLSNILLGKEVVPELLQQDCTVEKIMYYVEQFMKHKPVYNQQMDGFEKVRKLLGMGQQTPSDNAAEAIIKAIKNYRK